VTYLEREVHEIFEISNRANRLHAIDREKESYCPLVATVATATNKVRFVCRQYGFSGARPQPFLRDGRP